MEAGGAGLSLMEVWWLLSWGRLKGLQGSAGHQCWARCSQTRLSGEAESGQQLAGPWGWLKVLPGDEGAKSNVTQKATELAGSATNSFTKLLHFRST